MPTMPPPKPTVKLAVHKHEPDWQTAHKNEEGLIAFYCLCGIGGLFKLEPSHVLWGTTGLVELPSLKRSE
jgi:hypothetical protein